MSSQPNTPDQKTSLALSVALPAYQERDNLAILIPEIENIFAEIPFEIIVIDDNSQDGTIELLADLQKKFGNIQILERPALLGIGSALREGYALARGEFILSSDADLSFRGADMSAIYKKIQAGYDMVLGYKISPPQSSINNRDRLSYMGNWVVRLVSGIKLKNFNTNFRIFKKSLWQKLNTKEDRNFFLFETILKAQRTQANFAEIPATFYAREFGRSKINFFKEAPAYLYKLFYYTFLIK
ncbi:MAG: glycosyltransferase [bacterium]|nr:glycosyltransferase [bacterium]